MLRALLRLTLFPYTTLFRSKGLKLMSWQTYIIHPYVTSGVLAAIVGIALVWCGRQNIGRLFTRTAFFWLVNIVFMAISAYQDRKSTRLNSSHANISYAVFCL